jgi:hypothetical protein
MIQHYVPPAEWTSNGYAGSTLIGEFVDAHKLQAPHVCLPACAAERDTETGDAYADATTAVAVEHDGGPAGVPRYALSAMVSQVGAGGADAPAGA